MRLDKLKDSLRFHEGVRTQMYRCPAGHWTIGCGHNLEAKGIPSSVVDLLLEHDIQDCIFDLDREHHGWRAHSSNRQNVLIEMIFNLGAPRFATFTRMLQALEDRDYQTAAEEMIASKWANDVGQRAFTLAEQMRNG